MFDARELSILISGSSTGFNVADLREHTVKYAGGYTEAGQNFDALLLPFPVSHHSNPVPEVCVSSQGTQPSDPMVLGAFRANGAGGLLVLPLLSHLLTISQQSPYLVPLNLLVMG